MQRPAALGVADMVDEHYRAVFGYAYRLSGSVIESEDLTQQTFMLAQVNLPQLRELRAARGWLYTIVRNEYLRRRPLTSAITLDDAPELASAESDPGWLDSELNSDRLQAAIQELPNEFRIPLLMFYFEDRSYRDIADQLGLPQGTVMSRLSRAKTQLRRKLEKFILEPHS